MSSNGTVLAELIVDNERVRMTRFTWAPGAATGWHRHEHDYVIVPYRDCSVRVEMDGQVVDATMRRDQPYFRARGVEHNVISLETEPFSLVEIEIK